MKIQDSKELKLFDVFIDSVSNDLFVEYPDYFGNTRETIWFSLERKFLRIKHDGLPVKVFDHYNAEANPRIAELHCLRVLDAWLKSHYSPNQP